MALKKQIGFAFKRFRLICRPDFVAIAVLSFVSAGRVFAQTALDESLAELPTETNNAIEAFSYPATNQLEAAAAPTNPGSTGPALGGTSQLFTVPPLVSGAGLTSQSPLRWGRINLSPHLQYQMSYGNGVQASPGQQGNTLVNQVSPGILIGLGTHWTIDYTPTLRFYSDTRFKDGTDHAVNLQGTTAYKDWTFGLSQGYSLSSQPLVETGAQTDQETYSTALTANYQLNGELSLSLAANQIFRSIDQPVASEQLSDMREWSTLDWLNYQFEPSLGASLGAGFTYDNIVGSPDMTSEQIQGRVNWQASRKLHFLLSGGLNDQQFIGSHTPDLLSPIFSLSAQYQIFEATSFSLSANRAVTPSYFQGATTETTGINAALRQRFLGKLYLDVSGGYGNTAYHGTTTGPIASNIADYNSTSFSVSLSTLFFKRATASLFYQASYNSSGVALYNYTTTQGGFTLGYRF